MEPDRALDESVIERSALVTGARASYRSQLTFKSEIRSFQPGFPALFPPKPPALPVPDLEPTSDSDFVILLNATEKSPARELATMSVLYCYFAEALASMAMRHAMCSRAMCIDGMALAFG